MTAAGPAWLADDPYPGGPHWDGCERVHPHCAYRLGLTHGRRPDVAEESDPHEALDRAVLSGASADETDF